MYRRSPTGQWCFHDKVTFKTLIVWFKLNMHAHLSSRMVALDVVRCQSSDLPQAECQHIFIGKLTVGWRQVCMYFWWRSFVQNPSMHSLAISCITKTPSRFTFSQQIGYSKLLQPRLYIVCLFVSFQRAITMDCTTASDTSSGEFHLSQFAVSVKSCMRIRNECV
jgi:hypothetical protein